ncbi:sugar ABC transporter permease [Microbacterium sp. dk485]|uniref:Sugar ABC transporter permease n=2 Tax=Microbacteriaceae TaxID=85023 RepID=A0ABX5T151_9MICO|nr:sugar ABC transporter permease [Microbacterium sp. EYE_512]QBR90800.1 sugar ABC transporter permease [Microbacterium wangchenii]TFV85566.1 sugar ABC transporter permease [Microbacterium sp. dk485]TXK11914.1 sugar ABC transporter permease [Microbacterium wangchenii]
MSLFDWPAFGDRAFIGIGNYVDLLTEDPDFLVAFRNTVVFVVLTVPLNLLLALGLALLLAERIRGRTAFRVLFFIPVVTPMVANVFVWRMLLQPEGIVRSGALDLFGLEIPNLLADPFWAMVLVVVVSVWAGVGYNMLILIAAIEQLPQTTIEAARLDGASGLRLIGRIVLPLLSPSIFFCLVMTTIGSFQVFAQPQLLTGGGPGNATLPLVMFIYNKGFQFHDLGGAAAAGWLLFAVIIGLTAVQFRAQRRWVHYEH